MRRKSVEELYQEYFKLSQQMKEVERLILRKTRRRLLTIRPVDEIEHKEEPGWEDRKTPREQELEKRLELVKELVFLCKEGQLKPSTWSLWSYLSKGQKDNKWPSDAVFLQDVLNPLQKWGKINLHNGRWEVLNE